MVVQCCVCKKIKDDKGSWVEGNGQIVAGSHTYCPDCFQNVMQEIEKERATEARRS